MKKLCFIIAFYSLISTLPKTNAQTASNTNDIPKVEYSTQASFETINQDSYVPPVTHRLEGERSTVNDSIKWETAYPLRDNGYPVGSFGVNVGGRSAEDTQVTTLGVPLNLPQGGGADFSALPAYLFESISITPTISGAGFAPSASEGHVEFAPWTRARLLDSKHQEVYRGTVSYDHDSQTYSLGTRAGNYSVVIGAGTGMQHGYAGIASAQVMQNASGHILLHVIGTNQTGDVQGSITYPSRGSTQQTWRVIPVVETGFKLGNGFEYQSTLFADLSSLVYNDSAGFNNSDTRTQQYGFENALIHGPDTLAFSARYVRFAGASYGALHDWPGYAGYTHEFILSDDVSIKVTLSGTHTNGRSVAPGGKISSRFSSNEKNYTFAEVNTVAKLPTLVDRYSSYPGFGFTGNPDLNPERVYAALFGARFEQNQIVSTTTLKGEYRKSIQITKADFSTVINGGDAYLFTLNEEAFAPITNFLDVHVGGYFTYSKLKDANYSYPDLPFITGVGGLTGHYQDLVYLSVNGRLVGFSAGPGGKAHDGYTLFDTELSVQVVHGVFAKGGIDNILGSRGQAVLDYPIEDRRYFAALNATF